MNFPLLLAPSKKAKLLNGSAAKEGEDVEEEESDDPDFEEEVILKHC